MKNDLVAIIPARSGSKRIKNKNTIDFGGRPLIAKTIKAALESDAFNKVIVSTDCPKIAKIAESLGASAPFLRKENHDDFSNVSKATITALKQCESYFKRDWKYVAQLMPNCPLRGSNTINDGIANFLNRNHDSQISCFKYGWMNPWWANKVNSDQKPEAIFPDALKSRSQDLPELYCPTGALWLAKTKSLYSHGSFYTGNHAFFPMNWIEAIDIDDKQDLEMALLLSKLI